MNAITPITAAQGIPEYHHHTHKPIEETA